MENIRVILPISFVFVSYFGFRGVPQRISYQGLLTISGGGTATNGDYRISFNIYDSLSGGSRLWSENQDQVDVSKGTFHVILGSNIPPDLQFGSYYIQMTVTSGLGISAPVTCLAQSLRHPPVRFGRSVRKLLSLIVPPEETWHEHI